MTSTGRAVGLVLLTLVGVAFSEVTARACTCVGPNPPCQATWQSDAVFVARVLSIEDAPPSVEQGVPWPQIRVRLRVAEAFRGVTVGEVDVFTGRGGGDCGYAFVAGVDYLVYAYRHPANGGLRTGICSRTRLLSEAAEDLRYLRGPARQQPTRARIFGRIYRHDPVGDQQPPVSVPLAGIRVTAQSEQQTYRARTDANGAYEMPVLTGKYRMSFDVPDELYVYNGLIAEVQDLRGCAEVDVAAQWNGRVFGRILAADGNPVPGFSLSLIRAAALGGFYIDWSLNGRTDGDGRYEISHLPEGAYHLVVDPWELAGKRPPAVRAALKDAGSVNTIDVPRGQRVEARDMTLPSTLRPAEVRGVVIDPAGKPAAGVKVYIKIDTNEILYLPSPAVTDERGRFSMTVPEGRHYRLVAEGYENGRYAFNGELRGLDPGAAKELTLQLKPLKSGG